MSSRFNTLYLGEPIEAAEALENFDGVSADEIDVGELRIALINALKHASGEPCEIWTDSEFWVNVITKWAPSWERNGWRKKGGEISNLDIVKEVYGLYHQSKAKLVWVRGHNNHELNELADHWANEARKKHLSQT